MRKPTIIPKAYRRMTRRFVRDDDGALMIFGLFILVLMVAATGTAVDLMRYETKRVQAQYTLDRAVLAAASLNQTLTPEDVVVDYFSKAGLEDYTLDIEVEEAFNYRRVTASSELEIDSFFLHMMGVNTMTAPSHSQAEERILNIEISLVLDVSGSMGWASSSGGSKISLLRTAAVDFVNTVLPPAQSDLVTMSIVPYDGKVNLGPTFGPYLPLSNEHNASHCVRFVQSDFTTTGITAGTVFSRLGHFDKDTGNSSNMRPYCPTDDHHAVLPWSNNPTALNGRINSLQAVGWTGVDIGVKVGALLLDPSLGGILQNMSNDGHVPAQFVGRPALYSDHETMKVIVMMTDGTNTNKYDIQDQYKSGLSNVWVWDDDGQPGDDGDGMNEYSVYIPEDNTYLWHGHIGQLNTGPKGGSAATRLTYPQLWARYPINYVADTIYQGAPHGWPAAIRGADILYAQNSLADAQQIAICTAAKNQGVLIFAIGFEAPTHAQNVMKNCASTDAHYYDVNGIEISEAFQAIARTINQLKLTQ